MYEEDVRKKQADAILFFIMKTSFFNIFHQNRKLLVKNLRSDPFPIFVIKNVVWPLLIFDVLFDANQRIDSQYDLTFH